MTQTVERRSTIEARMYVEGWNAFQEGRHISQCPYKHGSNAKHWRDGFINARTDFQGRAVS